MFTIRLADLSSPAAILGFGIGMQVTTTNVDFVAGAAAVAILTAGSDLRTALRRQRGPAALVAGEVGARGGFGNDRWA